MHNNLSFLTFIILVVVVEVLRQCSYQRWWLSEWVTPGGTAIPGMTSLKDGDLQHSSALAQSPKGDIEPNHPSEINPNSDSRSRSDGRSRRYVQYRVDQSLFDPNQIYLILIYQIILIILIKFYYFFPLIYLFSFLMRGVEVKPPKAAIYRGAKCRGVVFGSGFVPSPRSKICANSKIKICKSMVLDCVFICLLCRWCTLCT